MNIEERGNTKNVHLAAYFSFVTSNLAHITSKAPLYQGVDINIHNFHSLGNIQLNNLSCIQYNIFLSSYTIHLIPLVLLFLLMGTLEYNAASPFPFCYYSMTSYLSSRSHQHNPAFYFAQQTPHSLQQVQYNYECC